MVNVQLRFWWMSISVSAWCCPTLRLVDVQLSAWWCPTLRLVDVHVCPCMPVSVYKWDVSRCLESLHFNTIYSLYGSIQETFARNWILSCRRNSAKKRRKELGYRTIKNVHSTWLEMTNVFWCKLNITQVISIALVRVMLCMHLPTVQSQPSATPFSKTFKVLSRLIQKPL